MKPNPYLKNIKILGITVYIRKIKNNKKVKQSFLFNLLSIEKDNGKKIKIIKLLGIKIFSNTTNTIDTISTTDTTDTTDTTSTTDIISTTDTTDTTSTTDIISTTDTTDTTDTTSTISTTDTTGTTSEVNELCEIGKKEKIYTVWFEPFNPSDEEWFNIESAKYTKDVRAVVILPVYKGYKETLCSLYHALKSRCGENYSLLVINDNSPDKELSSKLKELSERDLFDYHVNENNLGFVKTINYAISNLSYNLDVILLNSDAFVFDGWFNRLIDYADKNKSIATITPLSNNATIASYPFELQDNNRMLELSPKELDKIASEVNKGFFTEVITGIGFCFYMRRSVINEIGALDQDSFKLGYCEDNDFCIRAIYNGYKNIIIGDVFVYHIGSVSFSKIKDKNMKLGNDSLKIKHPNYFKLIEILIKNDPLKIIRRNIDIARLAKKYNGCTVFISHTYGGGIKVYLDRLINSLGKREKCILLEVHDLNKITIIKFGNESNLIIPNLKNISLSCDLSFLDDFFKKINPNLIHINSFAGLDWNTHGKLLDFFSSSNLNYKFTLHDYSSMCDNHTLLSPSFDYHGIPTLDERKVWEEINSNNNNNINSTNPYERREKYSQFFKNCNLIESPSNRAKEIVLYDFPNLNINVVSFDNILTNIKPALRKKINNKIKVSLIGCLSLQKGVEILNSLAEDNINRKLDISYSLIGYSSPFYEKNLLKNGVFITGKYENDFICCDKIKEISPDLIFISSICEETYSYTLSVALTLKIPIIVFNIGAQAERTKDIDWVVKLDPLLMKNTTAISDIIKKLDIDLLWYRASSNTLIK